MTCVKNPPARGRKPAPTFIADIGRPASQTIAGKPGFYYGGILLCLQFMILSSTAFAQEDPYQGEPVAVEGVALTPGCGRTGQTPCSSGGGGGSTGPGNTGGNGNGGVGGGSVQHDFIEVPNSIKVPNEEDNPHSEAQCSSDVSLRAAYAWADLQDQTISLGVTTDSLVEITYVSTGERENFWVASLSVPPQVQADIFLGCGMGE